MTNIFYSHVLAFIASGVMILPSVASAQDRDAFRNQAKASLTKLHEQGEPRDRCSMGVFLADERYVMRTSARSDLKLGDQILAINNDDLTDKRPDDVVALLRGTAPTAVISVRVIRDGQSTDVNVHCTNSRPTMEALMKGLTLVADGKFDECVTAFGQSDDFGATSSAARIECARASRNSNRYDLAQLSFDAMREQIKDARWAQSMRAEVIQRLNTNEGVIRQGLGSARFQELVNMTRSWPGGERMFDSSVPDWALFRRNAEASLRAKLIDPDSARIEWPYGFTYGTWKPLFGKRMEGYWTCGSINARNRMGGYTGSTSFVVVLDRNGFVQFADMGEAKDFDILTSQCSGAVKFLPSPQPELRAVSIHSGSYPQDLK